MSPQTARSSASDTKLHLARVRDFCTGAGAVDTAATWRPTSVASQDRESFKGNRSPICTVIFGIEAGSALAALVTSGGRQQVRACKCQTTVTALSEIPPRPKMPPSASSSVCNRRCLFRRRDTSFKKAMPTCESAVNAREKSISTREAKAASEAAPYPCGHLRAASRQRRTRIGTLPVSRDSKSSLSEALTVCFFSSKMKHRGGGQTSPSEWVLYKEGSASPRAPVMASDSQVTSVIKACEGPLSRTSAQFRPCRATSSSAWPMASLTASLSSDKISSSSSRFTCCPHRANPARIDARSSRL
mmetsp:Transcript_79327/g.143152  ORF Transcript_79327/g.143152 Transcript_79327/m.143152 type:complete len:302 (+) Transcript_79327:118-1023(+)